MELDVRHRAAVCIESAHPALAGHFPGRPIVPGVVLLDEVVRAAETLCGHALVIVGLPQVKFAAPLGPGEPVDCDFELSATRLTFRMQREGRMIAQGTFALGSSGTPVRRSG